MAAAAESSRVPSGEAGFTLVELLVALLISMLVMAAAVSLFTSGVRSEPRISDRSAQLQQARTMAERLSRELRQGSNASSADPSQLMVLTYVPRVSCGGSASGPALRCRVFYDCEAGACTRTECGPNVAAPPTGCGPEVLAVEGLADDTVFSFTPRSPGQAFVSVRLAFPATADEDAITVEDGVALRNPPLGDPS